MCIGSRAVSLPGVGDVLVRVWLDQKGTGRAVEDERLTRGYVPDRVARADHQRQAQPARENRRMSGRGAAREHEATDVIRVQAHSVTRCEVIRDHDGIALQALQIQLFPCAKEPRDGARAHA